MLLAAVAELAEMHFQSARSEMQRDLDLRRFDAAVVGGRRDVASSWVYVQQCSAGRTLGEARGRQGESGRQAPSGGSWSPRTSRSHTEVGVGVGVGDSAGPGLEDRRSDRSCAWDTRTLLLACCQQPLS